MVEELFQELSALPEVDAIALGGSRAGEVYDDNSDYDVYVYCNGKIAEEVRTSILSKYCRVLEVGNHFWEYEDNCTLNNGVDIDILYRDLEAFSQDVASVVEQFQARNGYTTCMWHNLKYCKILYDKNGCLAAVKERFAVVYPPELKKNIIERNQKLLYAAMPAYKGQIEKAVKRNDIVSINHRMTAFLESYFDILFALNEQTHPGEKRLIQLCKQNCRILPEHFEENIYKLWNDLNSDKGAVLADLDRIVSELDKILKD